MTTLGRSAVRRLSGHGRSSAAPATPLRAVADIPRNAAKARTRGADTPPEPGPLRRADPRRSSSEYAGRAPRAAPFDPAAPSVPVSGRVFGPEEVVELVARQPRLLADRGPGDDALRARAARASPATATRCSSTPARRRTWSRSSALTSPRLRRPAAAARATRSSPSPPASRRPSTRSSRTASSRSSSTSTLPTYNIDVAQLEAAALGPHARRRASRTRSATRSTSTPSPRSAARHGLFLVEDCCDALGSTYDGRPRRHVRRPRDALVLPRPPHHHWARAARS